MYDEGVLNVLEINDLKIGVHAPSVALESKYEDGEEVAHRLPPFAPTKVYLARNYEEVPDDWMPDGPNSISAFIVLKEGQALWLDYRMIASDSFDVAILTSFQGINTITGRPSENHYLEQYLKGCPVHTDPETLKPVPFAGDRYCPECDYKHPHQNYDVARLQVWRDGYAVWNEIKRKWEVRQWYVSRDASVGIASQILGDQMTPGIGFALFRSVNPKPVVARARRRTTLESYSGAEVYRGPSKGYEKVATLGGGRLISKGINQAAKEDAYHVGAGALVMQETRDDPNPLSYWRPEPEVFMHLYFVTPRVAEMIFASRVRRKEKGPLAGLKTGRDPFGTKPEVLRTKVPASTLL